MSAQTIHDLKTAGSVARDAADELTRLLAGAQCALDATRPPVMDLPMAEIGWRKVNPGTLRWVGKPGKEGDRDVLELRGVGNGEAMAITAAVLYGSGDPDDNEFDDADVADALHSSSSSQTAVLDLPALSVLHLMLGHAVAAMEAAQGVRITPGDDAAPADKAPLTAVK